MRDGRVIACVSEERLQRKKNARGYPRMAVEECLRLGGITPREIDHIALATKVIDVRLNEWLQDSSAAKLISEAKYWRSVRAVHMLADDLFGGTRGYPVVRLLAKGASRMRKMNKPNRSSPRPIPFSPEEDLRIRTDRICRHLDVSAGLIKAYDHHSCHAYYAYFASPFRGADTLVLTCDGYGDEINTTVSLAKDERIKRIHSQLARAAIGWLYSGVTLLLGMTPDEHEYKVMGLAPYAASQDVERLMPLFRKFIRVEGLNFIGELSVDYEDLRESLEGYRFDHIAGATQKLTEEVLTQWVRNVILETGLRRVVFSGGVAMNVKANMFIGALPEVDEFFVCASGADESTAVGAAYMAAAEHTMGSVESPSQLYPLDDVYLGPSHSESQVIEAITRHGLTETYEVIPHVDAAFIAKWIAEGRTVGRLAGRMEFGARALGNRTILADPSRPGMVRKINEQIKFRDFWMPFAPGILSDRVDDYLINPKRLQAPFMTLAFETTPLGRQHLIAAIHPMDYTARPQIVERAVNPAYWEIIKEFEKNTGVGAILNTSFNLHGQPIVCSPDDAIYTFLNSQMDALLLENTFVYRKPAD
jgi:carbamoyltransferase